MKLLALVGLFAIWTWQACSSKPTANDPNTRSQVQRGSHPYHVIIMMDHYPEKFLICEGALIDEEYVLTAAECVDKYKSIPEKMKIVAGAISIDDIDSNKNVQIKSASGIEFPPEWNSTDKHHGNIALVKLSKNKFTKSSSVDWAHYGRNMKSNATYKLVGYGKEDQLIAVPLKVIESEQKADSFEGITENKNDDSSSYAGAPLTDDNHPDHIIYAIAFTSAERSICFTKISAFKNWIASITKLVENEDYEKDDDEDNMIENSGGDEKATGTTNAKTSSTTPSTIDVSDESEQDEADETDEYDETEEAERTTTTVVAITDDSDEDSSTDNDSSDEESQEATSTLTTPIVESSEENSNSDEDDEDDDIVASTTPTSATPDDSDDESETSEEVDSNENTTASPTTTEKSEEDSVESSDESSLEESGESTTFSTTQSHSTISTRTSTSSASTSSAGSIATPRPTSRPGTTATPRPTSPPGTTATPSPTSPPGTTAPPSSTSPPTQSPTSSSSTEETESDEYDYSDETTDGSSLEKTHQSVDMYDDFQTNSKPSAGEESVSRNSAEYQNSKLSFVPFLMSKVGSIFGSVKRLKNFFIV